MLAKFVSEQFRDRSSRQVRIRGQKCSWLAVASALEANQKSFVFLVLFVAQRKEACRKNLATSLCVRRSGLISSHSESRQLTSAMGEYQADNSSITSILFRCELSIASGL